MANISTPDVSGLMAAVKLPKKGIFALFESRQYKITTE